MLNYNKLYSTILYCTPLSSTILYYTLLYYTLLCSIIVHGKFAEKKKDDIATRV